MPFYNCEYCDKEFDKKHLLNFHVSSKHEKVKCDICFQEFTRRHRLNVHMLTIHEKTKKFKLKMLILCF